jgi:hypothetical protein
MKRRPLKSTTVYGHANDENYRHISESAKTRFWKKVDKKGKNGCWNWVASKNKAGYGVCWTGFTTAVAHRVSFFLVKGYLPAGMDLDHVCHNKACVNPEHLRPVTRSQNNENVIGARSDNKTSGIRGVFWDKSRCKWSAQARKFGKTYHAGRFSDIREAEKAAIAIRNKLFTCNDTDRRVKNEHL